VLRIGPEGGVEGEVLAVGPFDVELRETVEKRTFLRPGTPGYGSLRR
jgi:hypothetical protein